MRIHLLALLTALCLAASSVVAPISAGAMSPTVADAETLEQILSADDYRAADGDILRLYQAFFERRPDVEGAKYWIAMSREGATVSQIAEWFTGCREFMTTYTDTSDREFLEKVYIHVLGRNYDIGGFNYWLDLLEQGLSRGGVVRWVTANDEFIARYPFAPADVVAQNYVTITDDSNSITMNVPVHWDDIDRRVWNHDVADTGVRVPGPSIYASPDLAAWFDGWGTPGVIIGAWPMLDFTVEEVLDAKNYNNSCTLDGRYYYDDGLYTGLYDRYVDCGTEEATFYHVAVEPADQSWIAKVQIIALTEADLAAVDEIFASFMIDLAG